jgi:SAM-dependent methyltransferase
MSDFNYAGAELAIFKEAACWKAYYGRHLKPYLGREVLEVGAGIGATTSALCDGTASSWTCLEPDASMVEMMQRSIETGAMPACCEARVGTLATVPAEMTFDTILFIDVLEHIEDDRTELIHATARLRPGGHLIILAPAHNWLYTPFDKAIGHFRRYDQASLDAIGPPELEKIRSLYLDSVGTLASLANRLLLRSSMPTLKQILFWDRVLVRASRLIDPLLGYSFGKSILEIRKKRAGS